jgi:PBP1b-binding outer membrane lipoprotein LpoB
MKKFKAILVISILILTGCSEKAGEQGSTGYPIQPVPFTNVKVTDNFWAPRIKTNHEVTIPGE